MVTTKPTEVAIIQHDGSYELLGDYSSHSAAVVAVVDAGPGTYAIGSPDDGHYQELWRIETNENGTTVAVSTTGREGDWCADPLSLCQFLDDRWVGDWRYVLASGTFATIESCLLYAVLWIAPGEGDYGVAADGAVREPAEFAHPIGRNAPGDKTGAQIFATESDARKYFGQMLDSLS